jgi:hypothetical protein
MAFSVVGSNFDGLSLMVTPVKACLGSFSCNYRRSNWSTSSNCDISHYQIINARVKKYHAVHCCLVMGRDRFRARPLAREVPID